MAVARSPCRKNTSNTVQETQLKTASARLAFASGTKKWYPGTRAKDLKICGETFAHYGPETVRTAGCRALVQTPFRGSSGEEGEVTVDLESGVVHPRHFVVALDCGPISNPDGLKNQIEGGILSGMSRSLVEEVTWNRKCITSVDWETYNSLHLDYEMRTIESIFVASVDEPANGAGETTITVTPAAIGNAIFDATGIRLRELPFTPERVRATAAHGREAK